MNAERCERKSARLNMLRWYVSGNTGAAYRREQLRLTLRMTACCSPGVV